MDYVSIIIGIIISIVLCFFGYRLKRIAFAIVWFVIGLDLGNFLLPHVTPYMQGIDPFFINILPFLVGLLMSLIGISVERVCIFLIGIGLTLITYFNFVDSGALELSWLTFGIAIIVGCVIGTVAIGIMRPAIILLTSYAGGTQLASSIISLIPAISNPTTSLIITIIMVVVGAFYQFRSTKHLK